MKKIRRKWSEDESAKLRSWAGKIPLRDLAGLLNRSEAATRVQAWKLGIKSTVVGAGERGGADLGSTELKEGSVEHVVAPAAIERALSIYEQLQRHDQSVILQARKILTQHIYGMVDRGEFDEQRLTVGGLTHLRTIERDHVIKSAHNPVPSPSRARRRNATT
jgi:hypothetical protein